MWQKDSQCKRPVERLLRELESVEDEDSPSSHLEMWLVFGLQDLNSRKIEIKHEIILILIN